MKLFKKKTTGAIVEPVVAKPKTSLAARNRYAGLILSIAVFLLLIVALTLFNMYASREFEDDAGQISALQELSALSQTIGQDVYNLKLSYGEDPKSPQVAYTLNELKTSQAKLNETLEALTSGTTRTNAFDQQVRVRAIWGAEATAMFDEVKQLWRPVDSQITSYLKEASSPLADSTSLDATVLIARNTNTALLEQLDELTGFIARHGDNHAKNLRFLQYVGIAITAIYFIIFLFYFMRKLRQADVEAEEARNETTEIFNTVNTGLFLLDRDMNIGNQYSKQLEALLGQRKLAGKNLLDILSNKLSDKDLDTTNGFVGQLYNTRVKERLISGLNPLVRTPMRIEDLSTGETNLRYLDFQFNRVYNEDKEVSRVLVNVSDQTNAVLLEKKMEEEREQNDLQLEMLATLLSTDNTMVNDFVRNTKRRTLEVNNILKRPGESQVELREKANAIFREVHSLKGEASSLNLHGFTVLAEGLEGDLKRLQAMPTLSGEDYLGLAVSLDKLMQLTQTIEDLTRRLGVNAANAQGVAVANVQQSAQQAANTPMHDYYTKFVSELAERNHKKVSFNCIGLDTPLSENLRDAVKEISVQLLRNAVVHGVETPEIRTASNKTSTGTISLELIENSDNTITLSINDDGSGINYEGIRAKAVRIGMYSEADAAELNQKQLLGLIFSPGFSTLDESTEDGGRGVGLDIIKERVTKMGGKINVSTAKGAYTRFMFTLPKKI